MKVVSMVAMLLLTVGCGSRPMRIDPVELGARTAMLRIEAPTFALHRSIALVESEYVNVTLATFPGCEAAEAAGRQRVIGKAVLTTKETAQEVSIPAGVELAIHAESTEASFGYSGSCAMAVRFHSEPDVRYLLRFKPHTTPLRGAGETCDMEIREVGDDGERAVATARYAVVEYQGLWKGRQLELCADARAEAEPAEHETIQPVW